MARTARDTAVQAYCARSAPVLEAAVPADLARRHYPGLVGLAFCLTGDRRRSSAAVERALALLPAPPHAAVDVLTFWQSAVIRGCRHMSAAGLARSWRARPLVLVDRSPCEPTHLESARSHREWVTAQVQALPRRQREVLVCRHYLGLDDGATGRLLGITRSTVRRRARQGLDGLACADPSVPTDHQTLSAVLRGYADDAVPPGDAQVAEAADAAEARLSGTYARRSRERRRLALLLPALSTLVAALALVGALTGWPLPRVTTPAPPAPPADPSAALPIPGDSLAPFTRVGFIGLPPPDARPSGQRRSRLVDAYPVRGGGVPFSGQARLYADGRLVWYMFHGDGNGRLRSTGYLEQRLTDDGVHLVRTSHDLADKDPLRLRGWLPTSAWASQPIRAFVPSRYGVCVNVVGAPGLPTERADAQARLGLLPASAARLLSSASGGLRAVRETGYPVQCWDMTTAEARRLDRVLRSAGLERPRVRNRFVLEYERRLSVALGLAVTVRFEPQLPDGRIGCSACG